MKNEKIKLILDNGNIVDAQSPVIVSASRATDIPAFYADWFFERLKRGYSAWTNPFNGVKTYVSYTNTKFIVFWSKNPRPLLGHLDCLTERNIGCYIQYTLNDYEKEGLEKGVPPLSQRIETFRMLVDKIGKGRVIWRFDPMILTDEISISDLLEKVRSIGDQLKDYTEKLVFSFADITSYRKVKSNLEKNGINYIEWDEASMNEFASKLSEMNRERRWNFDLATCAEHIDLSEYGIGHNRCIDHELICRIAPNDATLQNYLYNAKTDSGQRKDCGCIISKDIGAYNTCPHGCLYCYANSSPESASRNYSRHNPDSETIVS